MSGNKAYFCKQSQFNGNAQELFLQHCTGDAYILSDNGFYFYDREKNTCEKIQTAEKVKSNEILIAIFNSPELMDGGTRLLTSKEIEEIRARTNIAHRLRGLIFDYQYEAYMHRHLALKLLVDRENFSEFVSSLPKIFTNPVAILLLFENYKDTAEYWINVLIVAAYFPYLFEQMKPLLINGPMEMLRIDALLGVFVDIKFKSNDPKDICQVLGALCDKEYNDSVLCEKWLTAAERFDHVSKNICKK